jgi:prepilin-type N-terminal cleavage/methylation domain-containing protein
MEQHSNNRWENEMILKRRFTTRLQAGFSLIELLIALTVMTIAMLGLAILFATAAATNQKTKLDTTSTMLSQTIIDSIGAQSPNATATFNILDCAGNNVTINPAAPAVLNTSVGATTYVDAAGRTQIDWTQAYSAAGNYMATYVSCNAINTNTFESAINYEVRWNITNTSPVTKLVVVSSRMKGTGIATQTGSQNLRLFAPPATLRAILGSTN